MVGRRGGAAVWRRGVLGAGLAAVSRHKADGRESRERGGERERGREGGRVDRSASKNNSHAGGPRGNAGMLY